MDIQSVVRGNHSIIVPATAIDHQSLSPIGQLLLTNGRGGRGSPFLTPLAVTHLEPLASVDFL